MILLDAGVETANLPFVVTNSSEEMARKLGEAVSAYATLKDPMADPLHDGEDMLLLDILKSVEWLVVNATFDVDKMVGDEYAWLMFSGILEEDPRRVWLFVVHYLGSRLIARNYAQGWQGKHPVFDLELSYLGDLGDNLYTLSPQPLRIEQHWAKFTQAVVAQQWLNDMAVRQEDPYFELEEGDADLDAVERFAGVVETTIDFLAANYPIMGRSDGEKWSVISHSLTEAKQAWRVNILTAAGKLSKELANRG